MKSTALVLKIAEAVNQSRRVLPIVTFLFATLVAAFSHAQTESPAPGGSPLGVPTRAEFDELRARLVKLESEGHREDQAPAATAEELTKIRMEMQLPETLGPGFTALGPSLSKVYSAKRPLVIGGFGEVHYTSRDNGERATNVARINPILGFRFAKSLVFNSSFSLGDGGPGPATPGTAQVEFAYVDFLFGENDGVRVGNILVPVGLTNLQPEPTNYPMVNRPRPETVLIPTTWNENGVLGFTHIGDVHLQFGVVNGGDIERASSATWIRDGRQRGATAIARDPAFVLRIDTKDGVRPDFHNDHAFIGASFYGGKWSQDDAGLGRSQVLLGEVHGSLRNGRFSVKGLYTEGRLSDTPSIFARSGQALAESVRGGYLILSYDLLPPIADKANALVDRNPTATSFRRLPLFVAYEHTQASLSTGPRPTGASLTTDIVTAGVNYRPHPQVAIKADVANENTTGTWSHALETAVVFVF